MKRKFEREKEGEENIEKGEKRETNKDWDKK
jgi:hypothetical protein